MSSTTAQDLFAIAEEALGRAQAEPARAQYHAAQGRHTLAAKQRELEAGSDTGRKDLLRFAGRVEGALIVKQEHPGEGFAENLLEQLRTEL